MFRSTITSDPRVLYLRDVPDARRTPLSHRSPAVSCAIALGVSGCLIASAGNSPLPYWWLTILLLVPAIESEIRSFRVPIWLGTIGLLCGVSLGFVSGEWETGWAAVARSGSVAIVLLPLVASKLIDRGAWLTALALGALWDSQPLVGLLLWAAILGGAFAGFRLAQGSSARTLPLTPVLGIAAALQPLL
jgi:hypothetical protein